MHRKFIATILAAGLAVSGLSAAPAQARSGKDNARLLVGIAAVAIVGAAIAHGKSRKDKRHDAATRGQAHAPVHQGRRGGYQRPQGHARGHDRHNGGSRGYDRYERVNRHALPASCRVRSGQRHGYSGRCLSRHYSGYHALPQKCAVRIGGRHGTVYRDRCLGRHGY